MAESRNLAGSARKRQKKLDSHYAPPLPKERKLKRGKPIKVVSVGDEQDSNSAQSASSDEEESVAQPSELPSRESKRRKKASRKKRNGGQACTEATTVMASLTNQPPRGNLPPPPSTWPIALAQGSYRPNNAQVEGYCNGRQSVYERNGLDLGLPSGPSESQY